MLNQPIPAFIQGVPVRVYDVLPDGHWCWRWVSRANGGDGFKSAEEARAACEASTARAEGR